MRKRLSHHQTAKKMSPKKVGKRIMGTMKSSILQFGYRSPVVPAGETDYSQLVHSALKKFEELQIQNPKLSPFQILKLMRERYPHFIVNKDHKEGNLPGVEVGDFFGTRAEVWIVGLHRYTQAGIDWMECFRKDGIPTTKAVSIVVSGAYEDDQDDGETLIYTGEGGNDLHKSRKQCENQKLKGGTVALDNSRVLQNSIRVIRCRKDARSSTGKFYSYDGLYKIVSGMKEKGKSGFDVFKYKLVRESGQKPLIWPPSSVGYSPKGKTIIREDLQEELEDEGPEEPAQSSEGGLKAFLGPAERLKRPVTKTRDGDHGKGHGFHRGLKRRCQDDLSGAAAKPATCLRDDKAHDIENRIKRKKEDTAGAPEEASISSGHAKGSDVGVKGRNDDVGEDGDSDEPLVFPRLKLRAKEKGSVIKRNVIVDDIGREQCGVGSTREDLYIARQEESMRREVPNAKKRILTQPIPTEDEKGAVTKILHDIVSKSNVQDCPSNRNDCSNVSESNGDQQFKGDLRENEDRESDNRHPERDKSEIGDDGGEYEVDRILKKRSRYGSSNIEEYLVLWKDYSREEATWEPIENLINCEKALTEFKQRIRRRNPM